MTRPYRHSEAAAKHLPPSHESIRRHKLRAGGVSKLLNREYAYLEVDRNYVGSNPMFCLIEKAKTIDGDGEIERWRRRKFHEIGSKKFIRFEWRGDVWWLPARNYIGCEA